VSDEDRNAVTDAVTNGSGNGAVPHDDIEAAAAAEIEAERAQMLLSRFLERRPARFTAPGELHPDLLAWAQRFHGGSTGNLVITGNTGTGKSWSAWRIGEELLGHGYAGRIEVTTAYRIKRLATPPADFAEIDRIASADLLVLDDIGAVRVSDWDADHLYGVLDDRSAQMRPVIVITNATAPREDGQTALQALLGERVASRIAEDVTVVVLTGPDRRRAEC
jgi:DNA replication protein DnaC